MAKKVNPRRVPRTHAMLEREKDEVFRQSTSFFSIIFFYALTEHLDKEQLDAFYASEDPDYLIVKELNLNNLQSDVERVTEAFLNDRISIGTMRKRLKEYHLEVH